ncbi:hypothetical protein HYQ45_013407 [Verticillium longisporum]|uniref:Uncharacterized protein n=1 Tax=Verticillium longisporum TaxID=100787 RepID=A0A8I2ZAQ7_VERLO|nr:hypothetical protein HYQ45_013407 [Verticillium longisporum]
MTPDAPQVSQPTIRLGTNASNQIIGCGLRETLLFAKGTTTAPATPRTTTLHERGDWETLRLVVAQNNRTGPRLSSDNAVDYEVVFGDGRIANASVTMVEDLFGVLNDSGSALGLVTCSDKRLLP